MQNILYLQNSVNPLLSIIIENEQWTYQINAISVPLMKF